MNGRLASLNYDISAASPSKRSPMYWAFRWRRLGANCEWRRLGCTARWKNNCKKVSGVRCQVLGMSLEILCDCRLTPDTKHLTLGALYREARSLSGESPYKLICLRLGAHH